MSKHLIDFIGISKSYDSNLVLDDLNLYIRENEFLTLLGPSGCGKTTTLRLLGGFESPDKGQILFDGQDITALAANERKLNTVFQKYSLFPHMSIAENIAFGLKISKKSKAYIQDKIKYALKLVNLEGYQNRYPDSLSGGQQQRIAIARAIVNEPKVLLLDEPLGALDLKLRQDMQYELIRLKNELGITFIYVTHDQVEALTMSTKIALFREGELVQVDKPLELYDNPCDLYTADFIGNPSINFVEASGTAGASGLSVDGVMGRLEFSREDMTPEAPASGDLKLVLGIRPEQITISREKTDAAQVEARVYAGMPAGSETLVSVRVGEKLITVKELGSTHYAGDETVYLSYPPKKVNVFDASTKRLIKYSR